MRWFIHKKTQEKVKSLGKAVNCIHASDKVGERLSIRLVGNWTRMLSSPTTDRTRRFSSISPISPFIQPVLWTSLELILQVQQEIPHQLHSLSAL